MRLMTEVIRGDGKILDVWMSLMSNGCIVYFSG